MVDRTSHRTDVPLTEEGARRYAETRRRISEVRGQIEADLPDLIAAARRAKAAHDAAITSARQAVVLLKAEREAQGVTLTELEARTGLPAAELAHIEEEPGAVRSLATLDLYATALGKRISITLADPL